MELELGSLSEKVIGAAIQVHRQLGPGFLVSVYENALHIELTKQCIMHSVQHKVSILYDDVEVGNHILDLFVENKLVVELKAVREFEKVHFAVVKSYIKAAGQEHGLLLNFAKPTLEIRRVIYKCDEAVM